MTDIPTALDNKPSNLRDKIIDYLDDYAMECLNDVDRDPGIQADAIIAAITGLLPKKQSTEMDLNEPTGTFIGKQWYNEAIDTTLRNFSGQTEGEGE